MQPPHKEEAAIEPAAFIQSISEPSQRADALALAELMARATAESARMWGSIVGFGSYGYRYASGTEGRSFLAGFAPRKRELVVYLHGLTLDGVDERRDELLARLGQHRAGKGCLYVKRLDDVDMVALDALIGLSVTALRERYPSTASDGA